MTNILCLCFQGQLSFHHAPIVVVCPADTTQTGYHIPGFVTAQAFFDYDITALFFRAALTHRATVRIRGPLKSQASRFAVLFGARKVQGALGAPRKGRVASVLHEKFPSWDRNCFHHCIHIYLFFVFVL